MISFSCKLYLKLTFNIPVDQICEAGIEGGGCGGMFSTYTILLARKPIITYRPGYNEVNEYYKTGHNNYLKNWHLSLNQTWAAAILAEARFSSCSM